jgi:hypothetical protein
MSIIRLEWEDAVAALLNMLCKDRIHDYGDKASKFITDTGLAGGSNIIDEALKIEVLNALYKQTYLNNSEENNMYCITETDSVINLNYNLEEHINSYNVFILSNCNAFSKLTGYSHYVISEQNEVIEDENIFKTISYELISFITENMCINIDFDTYFIKLLCIRRGTLDEEQLRNIKRQIRPNIESQSHSILDQIREYLYSVLDKLKLVDKYKLFITLITLYIDTQKTDLSNYFNESNKNCQLTFIIILQLLFLQYMSYYICNEICNIYKRVLAKNLTNRDTKMDTLQEERPLTPEEQYKILDELSLDEKKRILLEIKKEVEDYLNYYFGHLFGELLSKIILGKMYNKKIIISNDNVFLCMLSTFITKQINLSIISIVQGLFNDSLITNLVSQICIEQNISDALNNIIEEKQIQVALSFFFYDMLEKDEVENSKNNNELITETNNIYLRGQIEGIPNPIPTKIGDIGYLLRMIMSNIEKLKASTGVSEIEDDTTITYLNEMRDILIKILQKRIISTNLFQQQLHRDVLQNPKTYKYYMSLVESLYKNEKPERIDYTFDEIYEIVKQNILNKIKISKTNLAQLNPQFAQGMQGMQGIQENDYIFTKRKSLPTDDGELVRDRDNTPYIKKQLIRGGKKISKKNISYNDIYYIIQSNLGLYNTSNNYYGGGIAQNNWLHMLKKFTIMALGMNNLTPTVIPAGTVNGGVEIDHTHINYSKFAPLNSITYGFDDAAENSELFSDWFNYEKLTIYGTNDKISDNIEEDESTFIKRLFINEKFSIPNVTGLGLATKYSIIDDLMNIKARFFNLTYNKPKYSQHDKHYDWFKSPPVNIPNIDNLQELKLKVTSEDSYANVKFPIYDEQVFNNDLFPLISKNITNLSYAPPGGENDYKMKYIVNNEANSISSEISFNKLNNYATFSDPGGSGSEITKLLEYGEKYIMGFYGITRILKDIIPGSPDTYLKGIDNTIYNIGPGNGEVTELITDGYITILNPKSKEHIIKIYSTEHNTNFNKQTPNNHMATYECKRLCSDFGVVSWQGVTLAVALKKSLDVLKKYMDSFIGKSYTDNAGTLNVKFIDSISGSWKEWEFLFKDYGVLRDTTSSGISVITPNFRINTKYNSIPSADIDNFVIGKVINGIITNNTELPVWDNTIDTTANPVYKNTTNTHKCWLRLPCFSIFNQISIFKGNGDICQELYTLTKFGGIYQNNNIHNPNIHNLIGANPEVLNNYTLEYLKKCQIYPQSNYNKAIVVGTGSITPINLGANNYYGAGAYKIIDTVSDAYNKTFATTVGSPTVKKNAAKNIAASTPNDNFDKKVLSISDPTYIPYDRFGNAPRGFVSGDRLSGLRYIMLSFLGLKYYIRRIHNNSVLTSGGFTSNQQLFNNINILSFGGYNWGLLSSTISKINFNFIKKLYSGKTGTGNNQIYDILTKIYHANPTLINALEPSNQLELLTNYAGINIGGEKKLKSLKKKLRKKNIKKRTKKNFKKNKKSVRKNIKKKLKKTYKNKK